MSTGLRAGTNNDGYLQVNGTDVLTALSSGSIGIGTENPSNTLHVQGVARFNNSSNNLIISTDSGDPFVFVEQNAPLLLGTNSTEKVRITSSGNVGIDNTNPTSTLTIGSSIGGGYALTANSTSQYGMVLQTSDASAGNAAAFWVRTTPDSGATINTLLRCENNGLFRPGSDATQDLGSASFRWANIYSADLQLSNEGSQNDVDGTWGTYTIQEGEDDLFLLNRRNGKKYKFVLQEVN